MLEMKTEIPPKGFLFDFRFLVGFPYNSLYQIMAVVALSHHQQGLRRRWSTLHPILDLRHRPTSADVDEVYRIRILHLHSLSVSPVPAPLRLSLARHRPVPAAPPLNNKIRRG